MKKFFLGFLTLMLSAALFAAPRTLEQAAEIAARFANSQPQMSCMHKAPLKATDMRLAHKVAKPDSAEPALYVFNQQENGFVIVSADDNAVTILGYSDENSFDENNIPSNVQYWLNYYAERIAVAQPAAQGIRKAKKATNAAIAPLMSSKWNQGEPYNNLCPMDKADNTRCYTGCVATAAAQIMYYYRWPEHGQGSRTYSWTNEAGGSGTESVNFADATYDWANMKNKHYSSDTQAQKTAIATLMYHVGVSCKMQYGGDAANGSGAYTSDMRTALVQNFKYKNTATLVNNQSASQMANVFRTELAAGRPILMGGATSQNEGHEFVCDGVDADGYFHINWGWGGSSDGYFSLSALDPDNQGAGGASSGEGFSYDVEYVKGIEPDRNPISVTGVTVAPTSATLKIRERIQLTATITPDNASNKGIVWSTSNANVANVTAGGVVIGVAQGTATITATTNDGNKTATCAITVTNEVAAATELDVDAGIAVYDDRYDEPWAIHVYNTVNDGHLPYIMFYPSCKSTNKIAGTYTLGSQSGGLYNDPTDENAAVAFASGQLIVSCVGKKDGPNGCNTYRIISSFTCQDDAEYTVDATLEICAEDDSENPIVLADEVGDGTPIEVKWMALGEEFYVNYADNKKLVLPTTKPADCSEGKVFVGWCKDADYSGDEAPTFAKAGDAVTANTTYYAVYAKAQTESGVETTTTYTFTSKAWADATNSWTSTEDGNQYNKDNQGVQVTANTSGAGAKTNKALESVTKAVVKYCTNAKNGAGSITLTVGDNAVTKDITKNGGTTHRDLEFTFQSVNGIVGLEVTCTTNSIYINSITITAGGTRTVYSDYSTGCSATDIEVVETETNARKLIRNGQLIIIRDNEQYTIFGQRIQ